MKLEQMYQEVILDHYRHPQHRGLREPFACEVHHVNPTCGDEVTLRVRLADPCGAAVIEDVSYDATGCSISQASTSVMTDLVIGRSAVEALRLQGEFLSLLQSRGTVAADEDVLGDAVAFVGVAQYPARVKCALLGWMALKDALARATSASAPTTNEEPA